MNMGFEWIGSRQKVDLVREAMAWLNLEGCEAGAGRGDWRRRSKEFEVAHEDWNPTPVNYTDKALQICDANGLIGELQITRPLYGERWKKTVLSHSGQWAFGLT